MLSNYKYVVHNQCIVNFLFIEILMPKWGQLDNNVDLRNNKNYNNVGRFQNFTKVIIICIDRDDDIGIKGGLDTPIIGKEACINAGTRLAIEDPEDSDCNAIFGAVKSYEEFKMNGYNRYPSLNQGDCSLIIFTI